jgi:putative spermidine/putrescine transport system permease protein
VAMARSPIVTGRQTGWLGPVVIGAMFAGPLAPIFIWAAADQWRWPALVPQVWGGRGWQQARAENLAGALAHTLLLAGLVAVLTTVLAAAAGHGLARQRRLPRVVLALFALPVALPPFATSMGLATVIVRLNVPRLAAVVILLVFFALPYAFYTIRAAYQRLDPELSAQAHVLGASPRQAYWLVVWPALQPSMALAAALSFIVAASDYVVTVMIGGGDLLTVPVLLGAAASGTGQDPEVAAISVAALSPTVVALVAAGLIARWRNSSGDHVAHDQPTDQSIDQPPHQPRRVPAS